MLKEVDQVISIRTSGGVETVTHDDGDWHLERVGKWSAWTATHKTSGTVIPTGETGYHDAQRVVREQRPDLFPAATSTSSYEVARGRQSTARSGRPRRHGTES